MHELSLAGGILRVVEQARERERFGRVARLRLAAGALAAVDVRALRFALAAAAPGTVLEGAAIEIDEPPADAWCMVCNATVPIRARTDDCPRCGGARLVPTGGTELKVVELVVEDR